MPREARILATPKDDSADITITCFCAREVKFEIERTPDGRWKDMEIVCKCGQVYEVRG